jgi:4-amino-4-deoxy-L-arabinose transferase
VLAAVLLAAATLYLLPVGRRVLYHQDEARFALLARQAVEDGRWILPRIREQVYLNKPPYYFWAVAAVAWPFGRVDAATGPLVSVATALAALGATFAIALRRGGWAEGLTAVLALGTAPFFFIMAHRVMADMMLAAWMAWALFFYLRAVTDPAPPRWALPAFYLCVGGGLGTKGPAALVVLLAAAAASLLVDGRRGLGRLRLVPGLGLVALTALPWLPPYLLQGEGSYTRQVVVGHYAEWYFRSAGGPRLDRVAENLAGALPWVLFLVPTLWWWRRHPANPVRWRLVTWAVVVALAVSLSGEQRARYFLPVHPLLALLAAEGIVGAARDRTGRRVLAGTLVAGLVLTIPGVAVLVIDPGRSPFGEEAFFLPASPGALLGLGLVAVLGWLGALAALARGGGGLGVAGCVAAAMAGLLGFAALDYPVRYSRQRPLPRFAERVAAVLPPGTTIWAVPEASLTYDLYLRRPVRELGPSPTALRRLAEPAVRAVLMREEDWMRARPALDPALVPVVTERIGRHVVVLLRRTP